MTFWRSLRALLRVEYRETKRHRARSALIITLIAVPVAAIVAGTSLVLTTQPTPEEQRQSTMGQADLSVDLSGEYAEIERATALLPAGATSAIVFFGRDDVSIPGLTLRARLIAADPTTLEANGLGHGMVRVLDGRLPANSGEVALAPALLEALDRKIGDPVTLAYGPTRTISGVVLNPEVLDQPLIVRTPAPVEHGGVYRMLIDAPEIATDEIAASFRDAGFLVTTRDE
ncbi:hypothetical protein GF420_03885, partial [candidate division GN15 bacterium]|nr:hypothetical protein [candidate division GN15 bacterium]